MISRIISDPAGSKIKNSLFDISLNIILETLKWVLLYITEYCNWDEINQNC